MASINIKMEHTVETDPSANRYICGECGSALSLLKGLQQHFRKFHIETQWACSESGCRETFRAPARFYEHLERFHSLRSMKCPYPRCQFRFRHHDDLCNHVNSHYSFVSRKDPDRCPYRRCTRRFYNQDELDRHLAAHLRIASAKAMAAAGMMIEQFTTDENIDNPFDPIPTQQEDGSVEVTNDGTILVAEEDGDAAEDNAASAPVGNSQPDNRKMAIGYILQSPSTQHFPISTDTNDYPELLALDESERPRNDKTHKQSYEIGNFSDPADGRGTFQCIIILLGLELFVSSDELMELWTTFLDYEQRVEALKQLGETSWLQDLPIVIRILRTSGLGALIEAWATFKLILYPMPEEAGTPSATEIVWKMLMHCAKLEFVRDKGYQKAVNAGLQVPDLLYLPPKLPYFGADTSLAQLLNALEDRVRRRKIHPEWLQFTKTMVLQETSNYLGDLKTVVNAMYPDRQDTEMLRSEFGPFW